MDVSTGLFAVIPAFTENSDQVDELLRPYQGMPLLFHSLKLAGECPEVVETILLANSVELINKVNKDHNVKILSANPHGFYSDEMFSSLSECALSIEKMEGDRVRFVLVLHPEYPLRTPENVMECFQRMVINGMADGIQSVVNEERSGPGFYVEGEDGFLIPVNAQMPPFVKRYRKTSNFSMWRGSSLGELASRSKEPWVMPYEIPGNAGIAPIHD